MSYPSVNFQPTTTVIGTQPINQSSATKQHPLGAIITATDLTYGAGEFIYLKGVASTAKGDVVCFDQAAGTTVRAVHAGTGSNGPVGIAMSDNVAGQYGWYAIGGSVPAKAGSVVANAACYLTSTAGQIDDAAVAGDVIDGMQTKAATSGGFATVQLSRPALSGVVVGGGAGSFDTVSAGGYVATTGTGYGLGGAASSIGLTYTGAGAGVVQFHVNPSGQFQFTDGSTNSLILDPTVANFGGSAGVEASVVGAGFILKSPNGTRYKIAVANDGTLSASAA